MNDIKELRLIEIELFSKCNRKCNWCPNREIDRTFYEELPENIFEHVIQTLKEKEYKGVITFSRYNEPLYNLELFKKRTDYIREQLPNVKLVTNTNGDYLDKLDIPIVDELSIMDYENNGMDYCLNRLQSFGAEIISHDDAYIYAQKGPMKILYCVNWQDNRFITDRAGFLKELSSAIRTEPCLEPKYFIAINYDGTVSPCCNIRNDIPSLQPYIVGDLHTQTFEEIINGTKRLSFINKCLSGKFEEGHPCYTCLNKGGRYTQGSQSIFYTKEDRHKREKQTGIYVPARLSSQRLPNKQILPLGDSNMFEICCKKLKTIKDNYGINTYVLISDPELIEIAERIGVEIKIRDRETTQAEGPLQYIFKDILDVPDTHLMFLNPCLTLLSIPTIISAIETFNKSEADYATSVKPFQNWLLTTSGEPLTPINYQRLTTKEIEPMYQTAHCFHIFNKEKFKEDGYMLKDGFLPLPIPTTETMDIDTQEEYDYAKYVWEKICN